MLYFDQTLTYTTIAPDHWVADDTSDYIIDFSFKWWEFRATISTPNMTDPGYIDVFYGHGGSNTFIGDQWIDTMFGEGGSDTLEGRGGDDVLYGGEETDFIFGQSGDDMIYGGSESDSLYGGDDDDDIYGGTGSDKQYGGAGNDEFHGDGGADLFDGGTGKDVVWYTDSPTAVTVNMATGTGVGGHADGDRLINIEVVAGSEHNDVFLGGSNGDFLAGWGGRDEIRGGAGNDSIAGGRNGTGSNGGDQMWGDAGDDTFYFANDDSGAMAGSLDTIWDFDQNGNDHLQIYVDDSNYAKYNWAAVDAYVYGTWGVLVQINDRDDHGVISQTQEIFLAGETASDMAADDFSFYEL